MTEHAATLEIPPALIAQAPRLRGTTRLLVHTRDGQLQHTHFRKITSLLPRGTLLVLNNSKVFPARVKLDKGGELMLLGTPQLLQDNLYVCEALGRPAHKLPVGCELQLNHDLCVRVVAQQQRSGHAILTLHLLYAGNLNAWLAQHACVPLPPYIKRDNEQPAHLSSDLHTYQTVYASVRGSVAAPTAGLHFSHSCLRQLALAGIETTYLTLHVSAGTFLPIRTLRVAEHVLLPERYLLPQATLQAIRTAQTQQRPIVAVGTTVLRALEDFFCEGKEKAAAGNWLETELFIYPQEKKLKPQLLHGLLTNFHQPSSTLFLLVCALLGTQEATHMYRIAVQKKYRFFSYGDSCLLWF